MTMATLGRLKAQTRN